jgi:hypothetical protein
VTADVIDFQAGKKSLAWKTFRRRFRDNCDPLMFRTDPMLFIEEACGVTLEQWQYLALFELTKTK